MCLVLYGILLDPLINDFKILFTFVVCFLNFQYQLVIIIIIFFFCKSFNLESLIQACHVEYILAQHLQHLTIRGSLYQRKAEL